MPSSLDENKDKSLFCPSLDVIKTPHGVSAYYAKRLVLSTKTTLMPLHPFWGRVLRVLKCIGVCATKKRKTRRAQTLRFSATAPCISSPLSQPPEMVQGHSLIKYTGMFADEQTNKVFLPLALGQTKCRRDFSRRQVGWALLERAVGVARATALRTAVV